jgi:hypothetical protein
MILDNTAIEAQLRSGTLADQPLSSPPMDGGGRCETDARDVGPLAPCAARPPGLRAVDPA